MNIINSFKKSVLVFLCSVLIFSTGSGLVFAQESEQPLDGVEQQDPVFAPMIQSGDSVEVGKNMIFNPANLNTLPEGAEVREFLWEFGDGQFSSKEEVAHIFSEPGRYNVKLKVDWVIPGTPQADSVEYVKEVFVYERSLALIADLTQSEERIEAIKKRAEDQNVYLIDIRGDTSVRSRKNAFLEQIELQLDAIRSSDTVIIWSDRVDLLTVLNSFANRVNFQEKDIAVITDGNIGILRNILVGVYSVLVPKRIIITRREAIDEFFTTAEGEDVVSVIRLRGYDLELLDQSITDEFDFFALPSYGMSYLQEQGIDDSVIMILLSLPVIVTLVTFLRLVIGLASVGARMPIIFTYAMLVLGWKLGIVVVVLLTAISYLFRMFLFKSHLLYTAKVGVLTSVLGVILLFVVGAGVYWDLGSFDFASALMLVILAGMIDRVAGVEGEKGIWSMVRVFMETLVISSSAYLLISWDALQVLLVAHPEILILFIVANVFMGRFTGLRLLEYFRFREVLRYTEE